MIKAAAVFVVITLIAGVVFVLNNRADDKFCVSKGGEYLCDKYGHCQCFAPRVLLK